MDKEKEKCKNVNRLVYTYIHVHHFMCKTLFVYFFIWFIKGWPMGRFWVLVTMVLEGNLEKQIVNIVKIKESCFKDTPYRYTLQDRNFFLRWILVMTPYSSFEKTMDLVTLDMTNDPSKVTTFAVLVRCQDILKGPVHRLGAVANTPILKREC